MAKYQIFGEIINIDTRVCNSGCKLSKVILKTELFDGTTQEVVINLFNNSCNKLSDIISSECKKGDRVGIIVKTKLYEFFTSKNSLPKKVIQLIGENIAKAQR